MPSETFQTAFLYYSGLTKIRTRREVADSTDSTEPIHFVLQHLRESFSSLADGLQQIRIRQMFQAERKHDKNNKASEQSEALLSN
ncbi:transposase [Neisseria meningitidis]|nr:transposase [Neisseria meningitidis]